MALQSWIPVNAESDFPIQNLPYGVFSRGPGAPLRVGAAIGDCAVDLGVLQRRGMLPGPAPESALPVDLDSATSLNALMGAGPSAWDVLRASLTELLSVDCPTLRDDAEAAQEALVPLEGITMHMPATVGDYTDFYSSREHATNVGTMFRGADKALQPNWLHLPVGYHGRASSVLASPAGPTRPAGQVLPGGCDQPGHRPTARLDFELEVGFFVGMGSDLGRPVAMEDADRHIFGMVLLNDWSARDVQRWEYVPLGPFGSKNFLTTISPWVVPMAALEPFRAPTSAGVQDPEPLEYLRDPTYSSYDVHLEVSLQPAGGEASVVGRSNLRNLYWTPRQQLVHHTVTGCNLRPGDLMGSGTISGSEPGTYGSMLELSWNGEQPVALADGSTRVFLEDGDTVIMKGYCQGEGYRVGFGTCAGTVVPSPQS